MNKRLDYRRSYYICININHDYLMEEVFRYNEYDMPFDNPSVFKCFNFIKIYIIHPRRNILFEDFF